MFSVSFFITINFFFEKVISFYWCRSWNYIVMSGSKNNKYEKKTGTENGGDTESGELAKK